MDPCPCIRLRQARLDETTAVFHDIVVAYQHRVGEIQLLRGRIFNMKGFFHGRQQGKVFFQLNVPIDNGQLIGVAIFKGFEQFFFYFQAFTARG